MYATFWKRAIDLAAAGGTLILLSPVLAAIAIAIRFDDGGPVIYRQRRIGRFGKDFELLKFRSMPVNTAVVTSDKARTIQPTRTGRWLRRSNVDELPQLINILKGEMSLVGPRPALPAQEELIERRTKNGALRCSPGLTGLAQVSAFDGMSVEQKAEYDGEYAHNIRFLGDTTIVLRTVGYLFRPPPVY